VSNFQKLDLVLGPIKVCHPCPKASILLNPIVTKFHAMPLVLVLGEVKLAIA